MQCVKIDVAQKEQGGTEMSEERKTVEELYEEYLEGDESMETEYDGELRKISAALDDKVEQGTITNEDLAEYEAAATQAAFFAGYQAAMMAAMNN